MEIDTLKFKNKIFIEGYGINKFKISGDIYKSPILILKNKVIASSSTNTANAAKPIDTYKPTGQLIYNMDIINSLNQNK